jgi:hypothetical protein
MVSVSGQDADKPKNFDLNSFQLNQVQVGDIPMSIKSLVMENLFY